MDRSKMLDDVSLDHVGVVVADLDAAEEFVVRVFGLSVAKRVELPELALRAVFFSAGDAMIELLEVTDPEARRQRLPDGTQANVEHIALKVPDLDEAADACADHGIQLSSPAGDAALVVGSTRNLWSIAETSAGIGIQLVAYDSELASGHGNGC
jgi:catechol 2,3-dioxygenase-like lactoylglutathione lyase family enzyme